MSIQVTDTGVDIDHVDQIFHIADVHIRNLKRHGEYREVFSRVYDEIDRRRTDASICVIAGDLAHAKTEMSPELVQMLMELLSELANRLPTFVIPGNHDANLNNPNRMDALTPVVRTLQMSLDGLHFFRGSGAWRVGDVALVHFSQFDDPDHFIRADRIPDDLVKVALYHGTVDKSSTDTGYVLENADVSVSTFKGYDLGLLGDIHRRQFMNLTETVAFPGSLIQQNHGEDLGHGFLVWDVEARESEYVEVENDYGFYTLDIVRGRVPVDARVPAKPRLRLRVSDTSPAETKRVSADIRQLYNVEELRIDRVDSRKRSDVSSKDLDVGNVQSASYQSELICEHIEREHGADEKTLKNVRRINQELSAKAGEPDQRRNVRWRLKRFEWDNMFSYGPGNVVEFDSMTGIVGLFAENASGKSSLLDAISFCLFDKCERASKSTDIMNNQADSFRCKAVFEMDGTDYVIEREAETLSTGHVPVDVDFYKIVGGEEVYLNGEQRSKTNQIIRQYLGEYEDFIATAFSIQGNNTIFVEKSQSQRKDLLAKFIGIDVFDRLNSLAKDEVRDVRAILKDFDSRDLAEELADAEDRLERAKDDHREMKNRRRSLSQDESRLSRDLNRLNRRLNDVPNRDLNIDRLREKEAFLEGKVEDVEETIKAKGIRKREKEQPLVGFQHMLEQSDVQSMKERAESWRRDRDRLEESRRRADRLEEKIDDTEDEIAHIRGHEFDPECEYCVRRNERDADKLSRLESRLEDMRGSLDSLEADIVDLENRTAYTGRTPAESFEKIERARRRVEELRSEIQGYRVEISELEVKKGELESELRDVRSDIELHGQIQEDLEHNERIKREIDETEKSLEDVRSDLREADEKAQDAYSRIKVAERDTKRLSDDLTRYRDLSDDMRAYDLFIEATNRDGVPYELIQKTMPRIEEEVNDILSQIVPFGLIMHLDGKSIDAHIIYDEENHWPVELASGMEKFVSSLAIRVALINISSLPRPDFLAVDEGFGVLDRSNLNSLSLLFDYLKTQFKFCVIISHLDVMRDMVNDLIEIQPQADGRSGVRYI